jgi:N-methylhydantoinase B
VGSILAGAGALRAATKKMIAIVVKHGLETYRAAVAEELAHGERIARAAIERIPDGEYVVEELLDDNGITDEPVPLRVALRVSGSDVTIDLTGSAPEQVSAMNCPWGYTLTTCRFALKRLTTPELPASGGQFRPLELIAPEGSIFNPRPPAGCFIGAWTSMRLSDMIVRAAAQALPDVVPASNGGDLVQILAYLRPVGGSDWSFFADLGSIGHGAYGGGDGMSTLIHPIEAGAENIPTELVEARMPVIKRRYELVPDSGGPGKHRGGLAAVAELEFTGEGTGVVTAERSRVEEVHGLSGGRPAPYRNSVTIFPGTEREERLGKKSEIPIRPGDRVIVKPAGGGGWGDPRERDPEAVARDVRAGYVSATEAEATYAVKLDEDGAVDAQATAALRGVVA